jgi:hypothetical protein
MASVGISEKPALCSVGYSQAQIQKVHSALSGLVERITDEKSLDIGGLLRHNTRYADEHVAKTGANRFYFNDNKNDWPWLPELHYGSVVRGRVLEIGISETPTRAKEAIMKKNIIGAAFALSYALDCEKPDRVIAIANSAVGFAATAEYFGFKVDLVEAHRLGALRHGYRYRGYPEFVDVPVYIESFATPIKPDEKILLLEDTSTQDEIYGTTYGFVKNELVKRHGIAMENISVFFGWPGPNYQRVDDKTFRHCEPEKAAAVFYNLLDQGIYFLINPQLAPNERWVDLKESEWRVFKELARRDDFESAFDALVERLSGKRAG